MLAVGLVLGVVFLILKYPHSGDQVATLVLSNTLAFATGIAAGAFGNAGTGLRAKQRPSDNEHGDRGGDAR
jgi:hypothetical protein